MRRPRVRTPSGPPSWKKQGFVPCFFRAVSPGEGVRSRRAAPGAEQSGGLWSRRWSETCEGQVEGGRGAAATRSAPSGPPSRRKQGVCPAFFVPRNQPKGFEAAGQRRGRNSPVDCGAGAGPRPARGRSKEEGARQRPGRPLRRELASGNSTHCCCILMMWRTISKKFSTCSGLSPCMANSGRRNTLKIRRKHA